MTVNAATITGAGFTIVAQSFPITLNPTQSLTLQVQFQPTTTGTASVRSSNQAIRRRVYSGSGPGGIEHSGTESPADGERWESEFQRDGEYSDDADIDPDVDWDVSGDGELSCDHWRWLHDRVVLAATLNLTQSLTLQVQFHDIDWDS
jgi:hypothetical protein